MATVSPSWVPAHTGSSRMDGIDAMRFLCFVAVVVLHAVPHGPDDSLANRSIAGATRFAVPVFFLISGYFLSASRPYHHVIWRVVKRLAPIFMFWLLFYVIAGGADFNWLWNAGPLARYLITGGPAFHLWYLPALGCSLAIVVALRGYPVVLICLATAFFLFGLAFGAYRVALSLPDLPISTRNGPFFGVPFIAVGYLLARRDFRPSIGLSLGVASAGFAIQTAETFLLADGHTFAADYYFGTLLFGVGMFYAALQLEYIPLSGALAILGRISLGMYCIHVLLLMWLAQFLDAQKPGEALLVILCCVVLSAATAFLMSRVTFLRPLVT